MSKFSDKAKHIIASIAPTLGAALGGPFGALAGNVLAQTLGGKEVDQEALILSGNPEVLAQLKVAEIELTKRLAELGIEEQKLAFDDTASARAREASVRDKAPFVLAIGITGGFFGVLLYMLVSPIPETGHDALLVMLGALGTAWANVVGYYFGSSAGSKMKSELMEQIKRGSP